MFIIQVSGINSTDVAVGTAASSSCPGATPSSCLLEPGHPLARSKHEVICDSIHPNMRTQGSSFHSNTSDFTVRYHRAVNALGHELCVSELLPHLFLSLHLNNFFDLLDAYLIADALNLCWIMDVLITSVRPWTKKFRGSAQCFRIQLLSRQFLISRLQMPLENYSLYRIIANTSLSLLNPIDKSKYCCTCAVIFKNALNVWDRRRLGKFSADLNEWGNTLGDLIDRKQPMSVCNIIGTHGTRGSAWLVHRTQQWVVPKCFSWAFY